MDNEIRATIDRAASHGITLTPEQFQLIDGDYCLDGMEPNEWLDAVLGE
ncbi:Uncharacterised protein [Mycobacteroides abscessus subsp. abscessus]|nr:hypothetical protein [Mycobacteroides abscessus]SIH33791.1 Uncharacterised protein [Mycobacteroides abscessus subsp. abscessus]